MIKSIALAVALGWAGAAWAQMTVPCTVQEDCDQGFYCHISPRCYFDDTACDGTCETTDPGGEGEVCNGYRSCMEGLVCCYPCGVAGCENRCAVPCDIGEPYCIGGCYLFP